MQDIDFGLGDNFDDLPVDNNLNVNDIMDILKSDNNSNHSGQECFNTQPELKHTTNNGNMYNGGSNIVNNNDRQQPKSIQQQEPIRQHTPLHMSGTPSPQLLSQHNGGPLPGQPINAQQQVRNHGY